MLTTQATPSITRDELVEMAELIKKLTPKEKERVRFMLEGVALISEAAQEAANVTAAAQ